MKKDNRIPNKGILATIKEADNPDLIDRGEHLLKIANDGLSSLTRQILDKDKTIEELRKERAGLIKKWFKKGQESVKRKNKSGCCCIINDDDEIVSLCGAHEDYIEERLK